MQSVFTSDILFCRTIFISTTVTFFEIILFSQLTTLWMFAFEGNLALLLQLHHIFPGILSSTKSPQFHSKKAFNIASSDTLHFHTLLTTHAENCNRVKKVDMHIYGSVHILLKFCGPLRALKVRLQTASKTGIFL